MYKIAVFIPESHLEPVKEAMFSAGAGRIGNYDSCSWETKGIGQFRPLENSNPTLGSHHKVEQVSEYKVEMVCDDAFIKGVVEAMKQAHPYEEPAFDVWMLDPLCQPHG
ncbi:NGG1p interacting factor NIF3 [Endozoicomonadaceae bacterium StTr2]